MLRSAACVGLAGSLLSAGFALAQQQPGSGSGGVHVGAGQSVHIPKGRGLHVPAARPDDARPLSLEEAIALARDELWGIETLSELCVAKDPGNARYHEAAAFFWRVREPRRALRRPHRGPKRLGPGAMRRTVAVEVSLDSSPDACVTHSKSVLAGEVNLGQTAPEAERVAPRRPGEAPDARAGVGGAGDGRRVHQEGAEREHGLPTSPCGAASARPRAFVEATTPAERQAFWKSLEEGKEESPVGAWLSKKLPDLMKRCGAEWK